jgi:hypothetical protein
MTIMHRSESDEMTLCLVCGAEISVAVDRTFAVTDDTAVCFACAVERGGRYDELHDTWTRAPELSGVWRRE